MSTLVITNKCCHNIKKIYLEVKIKGVLDVLAPTWF